MIDRRKITQLVGLFLIFIAVNGAFCVGYRHGQDVGRATVTSAIPSDPSCQLCGRPFATEQAVLVLSDPPYLVCADCYKKIMEKGD